MWNQDRYYPINGKELPSVTTILKVIDKSGPLVAWAVKEERNAFKQAMSQVLSKGTVFGVPPETILRQLEEATTGIKASDKLLAKAGDIGTMVHALIENHSRKDLGLALVDLERDPTEEERGAYEVWKLWAKACEYKPISIETVVYDEALGFAGRFDSYALVHGKKSIVDVKTSSRIFPEMFLQVAAYRHGAEMRGMACEQVVLIRLPKTLDDHCYEEKILTDTIRAFDAFLHCLSLWRWLKEQKENQKKVLAPKQEEA